MLVLSRKRMESVVIGSGIRLTVVRIEGGQVRLGIEAPDDLTVLRAELLEPKEQTAVAVEKREAAPLCRAGRPKR